MPEPLLVASDLIKQYPSGATVLRVLDGCSMSVVAGEQVAVVGPSGVGKSTLLHLLGGLDRPDSGSIVCRGRRLEGLAEEELSAFRNSEIGFVFQFYHLLPELTALENVMMPLLIARRPDTAVQLAEELLEETGLGERLHHFPSQLSGGERQRVAIARALIRRPSIVLADEPTGNLDQEAGLRIMQLFSSLHRSHDTAIIMVTHNRELATGFDRVLSMEAGGVLSIAEQDNSSSLGPRYSPCDGSGTEL